MTTVAEPRFTLGEWSRIVNEVYVHVMPVEEVPVERLEAIVEEARA